MSLSTDIFIRHPKCRLRLARWLAVHQVFFRARAEEGEGKPNSRQGGKHPPSFRVTNDVTRGLVPTTGTVAVAVARRPSRLRAQDG